MTHIHFRIAVGDDIRRHLVQASLSIFVPLPDVVGRRAGAVRRRVFRAVLVLPCRRDDGIAGASGRERASVLLAHLVAKVGVVGYVRVHWRRHETRRVEGGGRWDVVAMALDERDRWRMRASSSFRCHRRRKGGEDVSVIAERVGEGAFERGTRGSTTVGGQRRRR